MRMATEIPPMGGSPQKGLFTTALTHIQDWRKRKISLAKENVKLSETVEKVEKSFLRALFETVFFEEKVAQKIHQHNLTILPSGEETSKTFDEVQDLSKKILGFGEVSSVKVGTGEIQKEDKYFTSADIEAKFTEAHKSYPKKREEIEQYKDKVFELYDTISHIFSYNDKIRKEWERKFEESFPGFLKPVKSSELSNMPAFLQWYFLQQCTVSHLKELLADTTFKKGREQYLRLQLMYVSKDFTYQVDLGTVGLLERQLDADASILGDDQYKKMKIILLCKKYCVALSEEARIAFEKDPQTKQWLQSQVGERKATARKKIQGLISDLEGEGRKFFRSLVVHNAQISDALGDLLA